MPENYTLFGRVTGMFVAVSAVAVLAAPALARSSYDGAWSVVISTERGDCDRAYRYAIQIQNGRVMYAGDGSFSINGNVSDGGAVRVSLRRGESSAEASGRMSGSSGSGRWTGRGASAACSGSWTAERRS